MKTGKITLVLIMLFFAMAMKAQVHGVDGFYYFSAKQLASENKVAIANGTAVNWKSNGWRSALVYGDEYVKINMGIQNATAIVETDLSTGDTLRLRYSTRTDLNLKEEVAGGGVFTVTKDYPIVAMKFSAPKNNERITGENYIEFSCSLYNRDTGAQYGPSGFDGNRRHRSAYSVPYYKDSAGRDSVRFATRRETVNDVPNTITIGGYRVNDEQANVIVFVNLTAQFLTDERPIKVQNFGGLFFTETDTMKTTPVWVADTITTYTRDPQRLGKTRDEFATAYVKWIGTFTSIEALEELIAVNNGDNLKTPNQMTLASKIYDAKTFVAGYKFADESVLNALQAVIQSAENVCNSPAPNNDKTSAAYIAWNESMNTAFQTLADAQSEFLVNIAMVPKEIYNTIVSLDGLYGLALGEEKTVGSYTGKLVSVVPAASAAGFIVKERGEVSGQKAYSLSNAEGTIVISNDTLLLIPARFVNASNPATFVFSNRYTIDEPAFDMKVNGSYFYITEEAKLARTATLPDASTIDELVRYLFMVEPGVYDASHDDPSILYNGWEFNSPAQYDATLDPIPEWLSTASAQWQKELTRVDGLAKVRYQMWGEINQGIYDGKGCLIIKANPEFYANSDTLFTLGTSPTVYPATVMVAREHGQWNPVHTEPTVSRDSTFIVYHNTYFKRYLAIKWTATNPSITFNSIIFQAVKNTDEIIFTPAEAMGQKGNVVYWDMLAKGIPYGTKGYMGQFMSFANIQGPDDRVYVDWVHTYATLDEIPDESFTQTGVRKVFADLPVYIYSGDRAIHVKSEINKPATVTVYSINGISVSKQVFSGSTVIPVSQGFYIVNVEMNGQKANQKIIVK